MSDPSPPQPKRKRSPWFAFYPGDFSSGTKAMSLAGRGAYVALLCYQFEYGSIPNDQRTICRIVGAFPDEWEAVQAEVMAKFEADETGNLVNRRMVRERDEREGIREKRIKAVRERWANRNKKDSSVDTNEDTHASTKEDTTEYPHGSTTTTTTSTRENVLSREAPCSIEQAREAAKASMIDPLIAEDWWHDRESKGWTVENHIGTPRRIADKWRSDLVVWCRSVAANRTPAKPNPSSNGHRQTRPSSSRRIEGTFNDPSEFAGR